MEISGEWIDVSTGIFNGLVHYPGDPPVKIKLESSIENGEKFNVTFLSLGAHSGTHIDAPKHVIVNGAGVEEVSLGHLIGKTKVIHTSAKVINRQILESAGLDGAERVLFKTGNSDTDWPAAEFMKDAVYFDYSGAEYLIGKGIKTVGIDYLSIGGGDDNYETHILLLKNGTAIIEGLLLKNIAEGWYNMICLPFKIRGADGAPARVLLNPVKTL